MAERGRRSEALRTDQDATRAGAERSARVGGSNDPSGSRPHGMSPGKLARPYPVERCASSECGAGLADRDAYLYRDLESDKLVVFCGDCAPHIDLDHGLRFRLVAL